MDPLRRAIAAILLEDLDPFGQTLATLRKVDSGPGHSMALDAMSDEERDHAERLVSRGLLRRVPAGHGVSTASRTDLKPRITPVDPSVAHRYPDRYAVTSGGSHALGTFKGASMHGPDSRFDEAAHDFWRDPGLSDEAADDEAEQRANRSLERGPEWLQAQRKRLEAMSFGELLRIVRWNDPNGAWSDEELQEYGTDKDMLVDVVMDWIKDGLETPEEWIAGSRRPF